MRSAERTSAGIDPGWGGVPSLLPQLEEDKALLQTQRREAEQEKLTLRDELVRLEQDRLELDSTQGVLQRSLQDAEHGRASVDTELHGLRAERLKLQDKVTQVRGYDGGGSADGVDLVPKKFVKQLTWCSRGAEA